MIGDVYKGPDGTEYEVVWAGGEGLVPSRETKRSIIWTPPAFQRPDKPHYPNEPLSAEDVRTTKRPYNKTDPDYWREKPEPSGVDKPNDDVFIIEPLDLD